MSAVLVKACGNCHGREPSFGASAPLVTYEHLMADSPKGGGKKVWELVKERIASTTAPMPPVPNARLSTADAQTINAWIDGGKKAGTTACSGSEPGAATGAKPLPCTPDVTIKAAKPYTVQQGSDPDQYVCFGFDVNLTKKRHVTALAPKVDNKKVLHHILLFQADKAESPEAFPCAAFGSVSWRLVAGWAPGGENTILPPEAGFPEESGTTHWIVQLHYNNAQNLAGQTDNTGYDICTTETLRPNDAGLLGFGSVNFKIAPRAQKTISCDYKVGAAFNNAKIFSATPHMHKYGTTMTAEKLAGGTGAPEKILDQPVFSFENQAAFPANASLKDGDVIRTTCGWNNSTDKDVKFGEGTGDEMCFAFLGYYPKINNPLALPLNWVTPATFASCK
ncbi:MAG: peptidylglycine alpha-amidating monooxygenase [Polyangiaceae bacterium]